MPNSSRIKIHWIHNGLCWFHKIRNFDVSSYHPLFIIWDLKCWILENNFLIWCDFLITFPSSSFLLEWLALWWSVMSHSEALQSCGLTFQGVTVIKVWLRQVQSEPRQVWGGEIAVIKWHKHCTVMKVLNLLIKKTNKPSQASMVFSAYCKSTPHTDCVLWFGVFFHLERLDLPVVLGHTQHSGTSVGVPC